MINFCTLFDSYYLDKGIALYKSLEKVSDNFSLFTYCFDDQSYGILKGMDFSHMIVLHHSCFEIPELLEKKRERSKAEYCWTCTPVIIEYTLKNYDIDSCTYIDSDLYFFYDPQALFDEIYTADADVAIVGHRFKNNAYGKKLEKRNGKYCVQFNYFRKNENGQKVLEWWKDRCLEWCYDIPEPDRMGDQKYLNQFRTLFDGVHELEHLGGGVAPWNLEQYTIASTDGKGIQLRDGHGKEFPLIFYHFQNIRYLPGRIVNIKSQTRDEKLKYTIYLPYLMEIESIRKWLTEKYKLDFSPEKLVRSSNPILGFLQRHFAAFKIRYFSDVLNLKKLDAKWEMIK